EQADDALVGIDDARAPGFEVDAERLGEAANHIEGQAEALLRLLAAILIVFVVTFDSCLVGFAIVHGVNRALQRPEEQGRKARILLEAGTTVDATKNLVQRGTANNLPDLRQVLGKRHFAAISLLDLGKAAEDLKSGADAG